MQNQSCMSNMYPQYLLVVEIVIVMRLAPTAD